MVSVADGIERLATLAEFPPVARLAAAFDKAGHELADSPVGHAQAAELLALIGKGTISGSIAKHVLEKMLETGESAGTITGSALTMDLGWTAR